MTGTRGVTLPFGLRGMRGVTLPLGLLGESDCERLRGGLVAQPVNAASSLTYVLVGAWLVRRGLAGAPSRRRVPVTYGLTVIAAGIGSVDFHGPASGGARWLHDLGAAAPMEFIALLDLALLRGLEPTAALVPLAGAVAASGLAFALVPDASVPLLATLAALAVAAEVAVLRRGLRPWRTGAGSGRRGGTGLGRGAPGSGRPPGAGSGRLAAYRLAVGSAATGAAFNLLGRTGGPLCDPDSLLQGHALWHVLTAVALGAWAVAVLDGPVEPARRMRG